MPRPQTGLGLPTSRTKLRGGAEYEFQAKRLRELHERNKERCGDAMRPLGLGFLVCGVGGGCAF